MSDAAKPELQPLRIVGSRLQALALLGIAAVLVLARSDELLPWVLPVALACVAWAATIIVRVAELGPQGVLIRRINGTNKAVVGEYSAYADHRYLKLRFSNGKRARIEVPVEIRPQVRDWAEATSNTSI